MVIKEIIVINDNIIQYVFKNSDTNPHIDLNITVILNGDRAVLIDVGYPRHARLVREDLSLKGISVEKIIISHYHPDHAAGAVEFPDIPKDGGRIKESIFDSLSQDCLTVWIKFDITYTFVIK